MRREDYLLPLFAERPDRVGRDRLEILTALLGGPTVDPIFRETVVKIPRRHPIYRWECVVETCERTRTGGTDMCSVHSRQMTEAEANGVGKAAFVTAAQGLERRTVAEEVPCRICPERPATKTDLRLCLRHQRSWSFHCRSIGDGTDFDAWVADATPCPGYGPCAVVICPNTADSPLGLCCWHDSSYRRQGRPGGAELPESWWHRFEQFDLPVPVEYGDEQAFRTWCAAAPAQPWAGQINLRGLRPLVRAEIQWGLFVHTQQARPSRWDLGWIRTLVTTCRAQDVNSLLDLEFRPGRSAGFTGAIAKQMLHELRLVYFTPAESKDAGFLETEHFGVLFPHRMSHFDLTGIPQRWLRDLAWDYLADLLRSPGCPRSAGPVDALRRAAIELGVFLEIEAPGGAHDPTVLRREHMDRFVADQRYREREGLPSLAIKRPDGTASIVTNVTRSNVFNAARKLLRDALENGAAQQLGLDREFIIAIPNAGATVGRTPRRPFPDEVARALADEANLARLAAMDPADCGLRDVWEATVTTGRRIGEVLNVRWDCLGRYGGLPMFWHDQTKVGNFDEAIRIPERLYEVLAERQRKTLDGFIARYGYRPTAEQRRRLALFPTIYRSQDGTVALTHQWFHSRFKPWIEQLDLGHVVPHQARHTLATNLLRAGASLTHIRRYLGQVSDRMAEHYVHLSHSDLEEVLQRVWVAGPGAANPGQLLTDDSVATMTREQALTLAIDLSRRSTPAEGGFCTFQPVIDGGACPWDLNCHSCDKFVLSGADLLYWRRKREQWRLLAEGAPDDATADYLHAYFEPTARAIDGLEKALAGLGLLADALALDLRKPQDYFHRVWSTAFRAADLAAAHTDSDQGARP